MALSFTSSLGALAKCAALATALCASSAHADLIDFETFESPIVIEGQRTSLGDYYIDSYGEGTPGALVGTLGGNDICAGMASLACPVNNPTSYYNVLADSYFVLARADDRAFKVQSLQASFIGIGQSSFNGTAGAIELIGFDANNVEVAYKPLFLSGPVSGMFGFNQFDLGAFGNTHVSYLLVVGYACDATGCSRTGNRANFAIDNIATAIPEPESIALMGLGLLGLAAFSRRRAA